MQGTMVHGESKPIQAPYLQLAILIMGVFMAVLDTSVVNVAIPKMESVFNATTDQIQWVLTGYMLTIGVLIPISGWLTDRFGAKHLFLFSLATFTIGSALCGAAWSNSSMIVFRIIQALGGGFMMPVAQAMLFRMFPPEKRGVIMGTFGIAIMAAPAFGPALSGYLVEYANWRLIFYINVPFGILAFLLGIAVMHEFEHQPKAKLDARGFIFSTVGFFSLLYGLNNVPSDGWQSLNVLVFLAIGVFSLIALVMTELTVQNPVIELRVFKDYMFTMSTLIGSILNIALFAGIFLLPLFLQNIVGLSPMRTGLLMTPAALASAVMMPISGRLFDKIGARPLGIVGLVIISFASWGFTDLALGTSIAHIQWLYILRSLGMGMTMMPIMTAGMNTLPKQWLSQGSAVSNTARQVAASLGTALLTSILTQRQRFHFSVMAQGISQFSPQGQKVMQLTQTLEATGIPATEAKQVAMSMVEGTIKAQSFVEGMNDTFIVATILTVIGLVLIFFFASKKETAVRKGNKAKGAKAAPVMES